MELSGTTLTVMGMGVVFAALTLLAGTAWLLERIFRAEDAPVSKTGLSTASDVHAVIALAVAYHRKRKGTINLDRVAESMWIQQTRVYE